MTKLGHSEFRAFIVERCAPFLAVTAAAIFLLAAPALAHEQPGVANGFISGLLHPVTGPDHIAAMVAVGIWGAFLGVPAMWLLPVIFPMVMAFGGALGIIGVPIPFVETGIATSALFLGLMVALAIRPPLWVAAILVGAFAIFHGHAHGSELPEAADPFAYALAFVIATGALHLAGIAFGLLTRWPQGRIAVRAGGAVIAITGIFFLLS